MSEGDAAAMAPIDYTRLVFAVILGYALFDDIPNTMTMLGAGIVMASTIYITCAKRGSAIPSRPRSASNEVARGNVCHASTAIAIAAYFAYERFHVRGRLYPPENLIADTPYGPILFLLIPLSLVWVFLGATESIGCRVVGACVALTILLIFAVVIAAMRHTFVDVR